jgi:hypothetical protein
MVLRLFKIYRSGAVKNLGYALLAATMAIPNMAIASSVYTPPEQSMASAPLSNASLSKSLITHYKGKIIAQTQQHQWRGVTIKCIQGTVLISTMEWPQEGKVSAMFTYAGKSANIMGTLYQGSNSFEGHQNLNDEVILHLKGAVKEGSADGSIWFELNVNGQGANGLCVSNFTVYPGGQFLGS